MPEPQPDSKVQGSAARLFQLSPRLQFHTLDSYMSRREQGARSKPGLRSGYRGKVSQDPNPALPPVINLFWRTTLH